MKRSTRLLSLCMAGALCLGLVAGCNKSNKGNKDTLNIATANEPPTLSTTEHNAVAGDYMNQLTNSGLFRIDNEMNPIPDLVESYENTSDTEWIFKLKQGVKFHNDEEMKADDVVATFNWNKQFSESAQYTASIGTPEKIDDYTVKLTTDGPQAGLLYDLCHHSNFIVPKSLIDSGNDFNKNPIGTGPYKYKSWDLGEKLTFELFPDYFDKDRMPTIKTVVWKIIPEGSARTVALQSGEVDLIYDVEAMDVERLKDKAKNTDVLEVPSCAINWLIINNAVAPFDNEKVRKAINCAINREELIKLSLNGIGAPISAQVAPNQVGAVTDNAEDYDLEKAKQYLAESGVDPSTIKLPVICSNDTKRRQAEIMQSQLGQLGIELTIESTDLATYLTKTTDGDFVAAIGGYDSNDLLSYLKGVYYSPSIGGSNRTRTNDAELDKYISEAMVTMDADARNELLNKASARVNSLCPQISFYQDVFMRAYNTGLEGVNVNPGGITRIQEIHWTAAE